MTKTMTAREEELIRDDLASDVGTLHRHGGDIGDLIKFSIIFDSDKSPGDRTAWRVAKFPATLLDSEEMSTMSTRIGEPYRDTRDRVADTLAEMQIEIGIEVRS